MIIKKPKFWDKNKPNFFAYLLTPFSKIVTLLSFLNAKKPLEFSKIKTICVGNIYIGGTGKTPLSIKICELLNSKDKKTTIIKKFYSNQKDEQLLIRSRTNLISREHRVDCTNEAINKNFHYAIFDDGLQDKSIKYDIKICCFNSSNWIGNGCVIPAGPLREKISSLKNFDIVFLNGPDINNEEKKEIILKINNNIKIFEGNYKIENINNFDLSKNYIAFAGIGNPDNFYFTLKQNNFKIIKDFSFPDHYDYKKNELDNIRKFADANNSKIITTEKDYLRIKEELRNNIGYIKMDLDISNKKTLLNLIL